MNIDVIIPVYKPDRKLERLLESLARQTMAVQHIFLMNTGEVTFPERLLHLHDGIRLCLLETEDFDHGGTRDQGALMSEADYLLYMTQDAVPADERLVEKLAEAFDCPQVKAAYARQLPDRDCRELERYTRSFNYPEKSCIKTKKDVETMGVKAFFCSNVCAMYEKETYRKLGGFPQPTIFNEDMIYAGHMLKAGYAVAYAAEARVIHSHNYTNRQQFRRNFDLAVSQAQHPEVFAGVRSESEGIRMVRQATGHCLRIRKPWLVFSLVMTSASKYLGYKLGQNYRKLPRPVVMFCTMNPHYWRKA